MQQSEESEEDEGTEECSAGELVLWVIIQFDIFIIAYVVQRILGPILYKKTKLKSHLLSTTMPRVQIKYNPHIMNRNRHPAFLPQKPLYFFRMVAAWLL